MFRTALRSSARAAGALSASSRIASVCTALRWRDGAPMAPKMSCSMLNGIYEYYYDIFWVAVEASRELCTFSSSVRGNLRDAALTSPVCTTATSNTRHRHLHLPQLCRRCQSLAYRGLLHPRAENPWCAGGGWSRRDWPSALSRV